MHKFLFILSLALGGALSARAEQLTALGLMQNVQYQYDNFSRLGITELKTLTNALSGSLAQAGYRTCSSMPAFGTLVVTSEDHTYRFFFNPGDRNVPLSWVNANQTMQKKILVYRDEDITPLFQAQYYCPTDSDTISGYIRSYEEISGTDNNRYEASFEFNETTHYVRIHAATLRTTANGNTSFAGLFHTEDGDTFDMINIYRINTTTQSEAQHTSVKRTLSASPSYAEVGLLLPGYYGIFNVGDPVNGHITDTIDYTAYDANAADYSDRGCLTVASVPAVDYLVNTNCSGVAISDIPETPAVNISHWNMADVISLTILDP